MSPTVATDTALVKKLFALDDSAQSLEIANACSNLCTLFSISPNDLYSNWDAYKYLNKVDVVSLEHLANLQTFINDKLMDAKPDSPVLKKRKIVTAAATSASASADTGIDTGIDSGEPLNVSVLESLNSDIISKPTTTLNKNLKLYANFNPSKYKYRTMNLKLLDIADYIDERINYFQDLLLKEFKDNNQDLAFGDPNIQSQSEIYCVGRIVSDSPIISQNSLNNLNLDSLFLETSRSLGFGCRIKLDLSNLSDVSFYPDQIVAFKGINSNGTNFKVLQLLKFPYLGSNIYKDDEIFKFKEILGSDNLKIALINGPFNSNNNLDFTKFQKLIDHLNSVVKPDLIIILGPFISDKTILNLINNENFFNSDTNNFSDLKNLDDLFKSFITPVLNTLNCNKIILIPNISDISNPHSNYPQPSFNRKSLGLSKKFKCFPNPSIFSINEISIGVSNIDILKNLKDITSPDIKSSRIDRILDYILNQRNFYPLFNSLNNLDVSYLGLAELNNELPDLLILQSNYLKPFIKIYKNVTVLNIGPLFNNLNNLSTFGLVEIKSPDLNDLDSILINNEKNYLSSLWKRAKIDIFSI